MSVARRAACRALLALEKGKSRRLDDVLQTRSLSAADRALAHELARGVERNRGFLDFVLGTLAARGLPRDPLTMVALRLGAYQILFLSRMPARAAVNESVELVRSGGRSFANAVLRRLSRMVEPRAADAQRPRREVSMPDGRALVFEHDVLPESPRDRLPVLHSLPEFLVRRWIERHGEAVATELAAAANRTPAVWLRANRLRGDGRDLQSVLDGEGVNTEPGDHPLLIRWTGGGSPFGTGAFTEGLFVAQDPTAFRAAEALAARPGEVLLDLCAAPGTKATALAEAAAPDGRVYAYDVQAKGRDKVRENARRLRLEANLTIVDDLAEVPPVDAVLVDVPCSNTGVLARRVEVRRRLSEEAIVALTVIQRELLTDALARVRSRGRVLYSTCSIEPEENDAVVDAVVGDSHRVEERTLVLPDPPRHDGGFHALIRRA